jgi:hypothetical protein
MMQQVDRKDKIAALRKTLKDRISSGGDMSLGEAVAFLRDDNTTLDAAVDLLVHVKLPADFLDDK